ncbi:MAG: hypothetical protein JOY78_12915 [Pseudonocardia sp.]|nr:hypothetical protein [Pseudonocardia sp.]
MPVPQAGDRLDVNASRRARAAATGDLVVAKAIEAFDDDLGAVLADALQVQHDLREAAWRSRARPAVPIMVDLSGLASIPVTVTAELRVLVNNVVQATVGATLSVVFELAALRAEVGDGRLVGLTGRHSVAASLVIDWVRIGYDRPVSVDHTVAESREATAWGPVRLPVQVPLV